jgi:pyrroline-5-carboxylate reductase
LNDLLEVILLNNLKISFIGSGVMAEAMISGLIRNELATADALFASDPRLDRLGELKQRYGIQVFTDNVGAACKADVVVLSIKPQAVDKVFDDIRECLKSDVLVLSIVAGVPINRISNGLGRKMVVRSMPNTPAQIGEGITVWTSSPEVTAEQQEMAKQILGAFGEEIFMEEEYFLDWDFPGISLKNLSPRQSKDP